MDEGKFLKKWRGGEEYFTKEEQAEIERAFKSNWFVYGDRDLPIAYCSSCGGKVDMGVMHTHLGKAVCPSCNKTGTVFHTWRRKSLPEELAIVFVHRKTCDSKGVLSRAVAVIRSISGEREVFNTNVDSWYEFREEGALCYGYYTGRRFWQPVYAYYRSLCWRKSWGCARRYVIGMYGEQKDIGIHCGFTSLRKAVKGTGLEYGLEDVLKNSCENDLSGEAFIEYLRRHKYPAYEWLLKMGLTGIVMERILPSGYVRGKWLNMRGKSLEKIFHGARPTKEDKKYFRVFGAEIDETDIMLWAETDGKIPLADCEKFARLYGTNFIWRCRKYVSLKKAIPYIMKIDKKELISDWLDYLADCKELGRNMNEKQVLFPKDIEKAHAETIRQLARKRHAKENKGFRKNRRRWKRLYEFTDGKYAIVIPKEAVELVLEGEAMHNCVGGYVERVSKGITDVVFIRATETLDQSLGTMEIQNGRIIQARAKYNKELPPDVMRFVKAFEKAKLKGAV